MRGGIERAAFQVLEAHKGRTPVFYLDGGDSHFGSTSIPAVQIPQQQRKAQAIAEAFQLMQIQAHALGELDDARGLNFRKSLGLPDLADGEPKVLEAGNLRIAIVAARDRQQLIEAARAAKTQAGFVIALLHQDFQSAQTAADDPGLIADLIVSGHGGGEFAAEENRLVRGSVPVAQVQSKGRSLARLDLFWESPGAKFELVKTASDVERDLAAIDERIALLKKELNSPGLGEAARTLREKKFADLVSHREALAASTARPPPGKNVFSIRFIPLESTLPRQIEAEAIVSAYDRDVDLLNLAWAQAHGSDCPRPARGEAAFVGTAACQECHAEPVAVWKASKHSQAYRTLEEHGKQYHLDCVGCHVTGPDRPGGVCRLDRVEGRKDVGCESCHGPGSRHISDPALGRIIAKPTQAECIGCHNPENSPHFDFATYLPRILGPGHGRQLASK
jgi:hypothetical protein